MGETIVYPKIAIVTPCLNSGAYLEHTIRSVLDQEYPNLEYVIMDGGSTDNTVAIIKKYESKLAYWSSEKDRGMYDALNKGFKRTAGEIMAWIGSDDMYHPKSFWTVAEIFSSLKNVKWLLGMSTAYDELGRTVDAYESRKFLRFDFLDNDYQWLQQESCFWHRSLWEKAGGGLDDSLHYAGDFELWMRFFRYERLYVTNALIGGFRKRRSGQLSVENLGGYFKEVAAVMEAQKLTRKERRQLSEFRNFKRFLRLLERMKIVDVERILSKYKAVKFGKTGNIYFNVAKQQFDYN
jgi:glycosyltransferase involved in cell wall biosynthesis